MDRKLIEARSARPPSKNDSLRTMSESSRLKTPKVFSTQKDIIMRDVDDEPSDTQSEIYYLNVDNRAVKSTFK